MCGRKTLTRDMQSIIEELAIEEWEEPDRYFPNYNIAPTQESPVLLDTGKRTVKYMRWGLIPSWAKDESIGSKMINARSETLTEKPSFRNLVPKKRCIVISDGYFEWKREGQTKIPYYIHAPGDSLLPMAGLWDLWHHPGGTLVSTYTIITTDAAKDIKHIHNRMPVILSKTALDFWLQTDRYSSRIALDYLKTYSGILEAYPVSTFVNSPKNNSARCILPKKNNPTRNLY